LGLFAKANTLHLENKDSTKLTSSISEKALCYDLTVPFAHVVQHQNDIEFPLKRYQPTCGAEMQKDVLESFSM
jgi:histidyl-tRNA synthetase